MRKLSTSSKRVAAAAWNSFGTSNTGEEVSRRAHAALSHRWPAVKQHQRTLNWQRNDDTARENGGRNSCREVSSALRKRSGGDCIQDSRLARAREASRGEKLDDRDSKGEKCGIRAIKKKKKSFSFFRVSLFITNLTPPSYLHSR